MRIKTLSPPMIAALVPPKSKPEEAWRRDIQEEPADLLAPAPPEAEGQPQRVSLIDILREKRDQEQRASAAFDPIRLGRAEPAGQLSSIRAGPAAAIMGERGSGVRSNSPLMPLTGFSWQPPLAGSLVLDGPHPIAAPLAKGGAPDFLSADRTQKAGHQPGRNLPNSVLATERRPIAQHAVVSAMPKDEAGSGLYQAAYRPDGVPPAAAVKAGVLGRYGQRPQMGWGPPLGSPDEKMPSFPTPPVYPNDPGSGAFGSRSPTASDYALKLKMEHVVMAGDARGYHQAARHLQHFLGGTGAPMSVDVGKIVREEPRFRHELFEANSTYIASRVRDRIASSFNGKPMKFAITTPWSPYQVSDGNWFFAMGEFDYATTALVMVTPGLNGKANVEIQSNLHVYDRYNWNKGEGVKLERRLWIKDNDMAELHKAGLAKEFEIRGSLSLPRIRFSVSKAGSRSRPEGN